MNLITDYECFNYELWPFVIKKPFATFAQPFVNFVVK